MAGPDRMVCRTPTPGKQPCRIDKWKFDLVSAAILASVPRTAAGIEAREIPALVRQHLSSAESENLGSVGWYTTTVRLELEVAGKLHRLAGRGPLRVTRRRPPATG
ncbi:MAG: hypothetical protein AAGH76_05720 [Pseudomonadota bacterium]